MWVIVKDNPQPISTIVIRKSNMDNNRLTPQWTENLVDAFGHTGIRGYEGECFVKETILSWGWDCQLVEDKQSQIQGIDIKFKKPSWFKSYTADVKHNIRDDGTFLIEVNSTGWLFNPRKISDRIFHCNVKNGWLLWYDREQMKRWIINQRYGRRKIITMEINKLPKFVKVVKVGGKYV